MALIKCKECKHEISRDAALCPNCGKKQKTQGKGMGCGVVILVAIIISSLSKPDRNQQSQPIDVASEPPRAPAPPSPRPDKPSNHITEPKIPEVNTTTPIQNPQPELPWDERLTRMAAGTEAIAPPPEPNWTERKLDCQNKAANQFIPPKIGQRISFVLQNGVERAGKLLELNAESLTIEVTNGSFTFRRNDVRQDSRSKLFVADYVENKSQLEISKEMAVFKEQYRKYEELLADKKEIDDAMANAAQQKERNEKFAANLSGWDGSLKSLKRHTENAMHDPDSFEHIQTRFVPAGENFIVKMDFRGKNAFGALVRNSITAKVDSDGNILQILGGDP